MPGSAGTSHIGDLDSCSSDHVQSAYVPARLTVWRNLRRLGNFAALNAIMSLRRYFQQVDLWTTSSNLIARSWMIFAFAGTG
jgi:hypothetical protein